MKQLSVKCAIYRGGTSRGIFFKEEDLPTSRLQWNSIFMEAIDAYNPSQVDGLGGGTSHTSKIIVVSKASLIEEVCLSYTFYQIGIGNPIVDKEGTCGNLMAAVGAFAVDEGYVSVPKGNKSINLVVHNTNIGRNVRMEVPVTARGNAEVQGDFLMSGLSRPGARISVSILSPGGGKTGTTFPCDHTTELTTTRGVFTVTIADIVNPFIFVRAADLGLNGTEMNVDLTANDELMKLLEEIRLAGAVKAGLSSTIEEAKKVPSIPKIALVFPPTDYWTTSGDVIKANEVDVVSRMVSMGKIHRTFAGSGLYNLASALLLSGTVPSNLYTGTKKSGRQIVRIGHPDGVAEVHASITNDGLDVATVGLDRTARRIMTGQCYIHEGRIL